MKYLFLLGIFFSFEALAAGKTKPAHGIHVLQMDEDFPIEQIDDPAITTHPLSEMGSNSEALPVPVLNRFFQKSGLAPYLEGWTGLELDLLALRCEKQDTAKVAEKYGNKLPIEALERFKSLAAKYRKERDRQ